MADPSPFQSQLNTLQEALERLGRGDLYERLVSMAKPAWVASFPHSPISDESIPIGSSKMGGDPDLPADYPWPLAGVRPLSFLFQVRLDHLPEAPKYVERPSVGLLSVFYDLVQSPPVGPKGLRVLRTDGPWKRRETPSRAMKVPASAVAWHGDLRVPGVFHPDFPEAPTPELVEALLESNGVYGELQLFGSASPPRALDPIAMVGSPDGADHDPWVLFAQIPSDELCQLVFLGMGTLYVLVPQADLGAGVFERATFTLIVP